MDAAARDGGRPRSPHLYWTLLPLLAAAVGYAWTLGGFFLSDDFAMLHRAMTARDWFEASHLPRTGHMSWLRPVSQWSWWGQWGMGGLDPVGYRVFNLAFHGLNAALVAWLTGALVRGRGALWGGALAGIAFALAPIHPEAVTWISGRVDVLSTTGVLVALLAWVRFCREDGRRRHLAVAYVGLCFGLGAKEMACTLPVLAAVLWFARAGGTGRPRRTRLLGLVTLGVLVLGYFWVRFLVLDGLGGVVVKEGAEAGSLQARFDPMAALGFQVRALRLSLAPLHRNHHPGDWNLLRLLPLVGWALLVALASKAGGARRTLKDIGVLAALFVVSTAPIAGWGYVSDQSFMSSRYLYLPSVFVAVLFGVLASGALARPRVTAGAALLVLVPWTYQLFEVNGAWVRAAATSERLVMTLPSQADVKRLCVTGLPDNTGGAYVMRVGFEHAVELFADRTDRVAVVELHEWEAMRAELIPKGARPEVFQRWDRERGWVLEP